MLLWGLRKILERIEHGYGREADLDLVMDACDNISPGVTWPPAQTTICVLGPSIHPRSRPGFACSAMSTWRTSTKAGVPFRRTGYPGDLARSNPVESSGLHTTPTEAMDRPGRAGFRRWYRWCVNAASGDGIDLLR
jgi:hypothetical protein